MRVGGEWMESNISGSNGSKATRTLAAYVLSALVLMAIASTSMALEGQQAALPEPPKYDDVLDRMAQPFLDQRHESIAKIKTRQQAEARKAKVRATLLRLIGGLPESREALNATVAGTLREDGFHIDRIIYDSLPGYHVTANLYIPDGRQGPFPAVVMHAGHGPSGKAGAFGIASNMARNGIAVMAYDPLGAGERIQALNPQTGKSWAGGDEHSQAQIPISLIGDSVARYMVWDAMRGVDYLVTRKEIDANRIGSFGCSGGGTLSAYLMALDERIKAGVTACYLTSYQELLKSIGPQDGEQVIPGFIESGLDFADLVELAAPRAYGVVATTEDMFPFAGARATYEEASRIYGLYGAEDRIRFFTGPGHHGAIAPLMPGVVAFFLKNLANQDAPPTMSSLAPPPPEALRCTATGQVTTSLPGKTIYEINRQRADMLERPAAKIASERQLKELQERLKTEIPQLNGMGGLTAETPTIDGVSTEQRNGYLLRSGIFHSHSGLLLPVRIAIPLGPGPHPALLMTSEEPIDTWTGLGSRFDRMASKGSLVLGLVPLPWPKSTDADRPTMGTMLPMTSRAFLIGKTLVGMRATDDLAAINWLVQQPQTDRSEISAFASGPSAVALLHATVLDERIGKVTLERSLISYRSVVDASVHRGVTEAVIPGVLRHYDLDDLMIALGPRQVTVVEPIDAAGEVLDEPRYRVAMSRVFAAEAALGLSGHLQVASAVW